MLINPGAKQKCKKEKGEHFTSFYSDHFTQHEK